MRPRNLKQAAEAALLAWDGAAPVPGQVEAASMEVVVGGERVLVALRARDDGLDCVCSCLEKDCDHIRVALSTLVGDSAAEPSSVPAPPPVFSSVPPPAPPPAVESVFAPLGPAADLDALAEAFDDVVTAVVRSGVGTPNAPPVREAIERLLQAAKEPLPAGLDRWCGRLKVALAERDLHMVGRLLSGAVSFGAEVRASPQSDASRIEAWLGAELVSGPTTVALSDRTLLEIGRDVLDGAGRASIDRRYLVDLDSGEVFYEDKRKVGAGVSIGPCPRVVHVGLAIARPTPPPRPARLLQYTSVPLPSEGHWVQLQNVLIRSFGVLVDRARAAVQEDPGLAEPFAIVAPQAVGGASLSLLDDAGYALPLTGGQEPGVLAYLQELFEHEVPAFVAGRVVERQGALMLRPVSVGFADGAAMRHVRV